MSLAPLAHCLEPITEGEILRERDGGGEELESSSI